MQLLSNPQMRATSIEVLCCAHQTRSPGVQLYNISPENLNIEPPLDDEGQNVKHSFEGM